MLGQYFKMACGLGLLLGTSFSAMAVPAKPGLLPFTQPDGSTVMVRLIGDERTHLYYSEDGYLLVNTDNRLCYATVSDQGLPESTGVTAVNINLRSAADRQLLAATSQASLQQAAEKYVAMAPERKMNSASPLRAPRAAASDNDDDDAPGIPGLFPRNNFPTKGSPKSLVILVEYTDVKFTVEDPQEYFGRFLHEQGFSDYGATGSVDDYFLENSHGQFTPEFILAGPVTLSHNMAYYGGNNWSGDDQRPADMVIEACQALDDDYDFSEFDTDNDGVIDNVFVFYAGRGEASGGSADSVWPHSWYVQGGAGRTIYLDGVLLDRYACSNEWEGSHPDGIGTFVHEFSHVLGLPDLYATQYTGAFTPGAWSVMDYGPYNNGGNTPPYYSAFERGALGWLEPAEIDQPLNATLPPVNQNRGGIIRTSDPNEYFIVENRQRTGWDTYIPGHGMLIWHIDYDGSVWNSNRVNNSAAHQYVDIEEADNTQSDYSRDGDSFPGSEGVTSFTDDTKPSMRTWSGKKLNMPITDIAESSDGMITFKVLGGGEPIQPINVLDIYDVHAEGFSINWEQVEGLNYYLTIYYLDDDDQPTMVEGYHHRNLGKVDSHSVTGLMPETEYYVYATHGNGWEECEPSEILTVYTGKQTFDRLKVRAFDPTEISAHGFTASWEPVEDAISYNLYLGEIVKGKPFEDTCGFDNGVKGLPAGWSTNTTTTYSMTSYCGQAAPALRFGRNFDRVEATGYDDGISSVTFWHRGNSTHATDSIKVETYADGSWAEAAILPIVKEKGGELSTIADLPQATTGVRISYLRNSGKGSLAIDDVTLRHGFTDSIAIIDTYAPRELGNVTEYTVDDLQPLTRYAYYLTAFDGELTSRASRKIEVNTNSASAINAIQAEAALQVAVNGREVAVAGLKDATIVEVYDIAGRLVTSAEARSGRASLTLPSAGLYIVRAGAEGSTRISIR